MQEKMYYEIPGVGLGTATVTARREERTKVLENMVVKRIWAEERRAECC
jgi:hypothetical protein